jgi:hypothetical protein
MRMQKTKYMFIFPHPKADENRNADVSPCIGSTVKVTKLISEEYCRLGCDAL